MAIERGEALNLASELIKLAKTRDFQRFLEGLNYYDAMKKLDEKMKTPEFRKKVQESILLLTSERGMHIMAGQDGNVHIIRH